ncbi:hypothetical protein OLCHANIL_00076 [Vibrio phage V05]|uniref:Uncharacterized protein n=1 Tax=Vibrio phage phi-pp2 TaxID=1204514 RepID=I6XCD6_9CAUD|nr:hypothetical protein pp2_248 [Vibrio phage phi-pp2]QIW90173.1 hypothetical protein OLCHANIL_00076 [Vibrio phage V05]
MLRTNIAIEELKIRMHPFDQVANANNDDSSVRDWRQIPDVANDNILKNSVLPSWVIREFHWRDISFNQPSMGDLPVEYKTEAGEIGKCQSHYLGELDDCKFWRPDIVSLNAQFIDSKDVDKALAELQAVDVFDASQGFADGRPDPVSHNEHGITDDELEAAIVEAEMAAAVDALKVESQSLFDPDHVYYMNEKYYIIGDDPFDENYCYALNAAKYPQRIAKSQIVTDEQYKEAEVLKSQFPQMWTAQDYAKLAKFIRSKK